MTPSASGSKTLRGNGRVIPHGYEKERDACYAKLTIRIRTASLKAERTDRQEVVGDFPTGNSANCRYVDGPTKRRMSSCFAVAIPVCGLREVKMDNTGISQAG